MAGGRDVSEPQGHVPMPNMKQEFLSAMEEAWDLGYQAGLAASADSDAIPFTHGYLSQIIYQQARITADWVSIPQARAIANLAATEILSLCKVRTPPRDAILDRALHDAIAAIGSSPLRPE